MKTLRPIAHRSASFLCCIASLCMLAGLSHIQAATISLSSQDIAGESSFTTSGHWSNSLAPSSDNDYVVATKVIRTPATSGNYTFAGNSLTISGTSSSSTGLLVYKGSSSSDIITVNSLYLNNYGGVTNGTSPNTFTLAGTVILNSGNTGIFQLTGTNGGFTVASTIIGEGSLLISSTNTSQSSSSVTLTGNSTFSGGTVISQYAFAVASSTNAFGTGNVTVDGGMLKLDVSDAIAESASLIISSGLTRQLVGLYYADTMTISGLSMDGGSTYIAEGTYTIDDLNSLYGYDIFFGDGITDSATIQVIPEPSITCAMLMGGCLLASLFTLRKRKAFGLFSAV